MKSGIFDGIGEAIIEMLAAKLKLFRHKKVGEYLSG
jgi:hypothetical protein